VPTSTRWRGIVATLIATLCLVVLAANTNPAELQRVANQVNYALLCAAIGVSAATVVTKGLRWSALYPAWARPDPVRAISGVAAGQVANWAVPWRLGELLRVGLVALPNVDARRRSFAAGAGVLLAEKGLDGVMLLATVALLVAVSGVPTWLSVTAVVVTLFGCAGGLALVVGLRRGSTPRWFEALTARLTGRLPPGFAGLIDDAAGIREGLSSWLSARFGIEVIGWSALSWGLGAVVNWVVFISVGINPVPAAGAALAVLAAVYGAAVIPTIPGRLGVFQYACVLALGPFGVQVEQALVFSVGLYLAVYVPPLVVGLASMLVSRGALPSKLASPGRQQPV